MINFWCVVSEKMTFDNWPKIHKITNYSTKNRNAIPDLTNVVAVHLRNYHTKFEKQIRAAL